MSSRLGRVVLLAVALGSAACSSGFHFVAPQQQSDPQWTRLPTRPGRPAPAQVVPDRTE